MSCYFLLALLLVIILYNVKLHVKVITCMPLGCHAFHVVLSTSHYNYVTQLVMTNIVNRLNWNINSNHCNSNNDSLPRVHSQLNSHVSQHGSHTSQLDSHVSQLDSHVSQILEGLLDYLPIETK